MIGRIAGVVIHRGRDQVMIDVRGVGYVVHVSERTAAALPPVGQAAALFTELLVREDLLQLFGFPTLYEKEWHRLLTGVQGVGARVSLAILGTLGPEGLGRAIALGDATAIRRAPGVGPKLAQRVVLELKDKAPEIMVLAGSLAGGAAEPGIEPGTAAASAGGSMPPVEAPPPQPGAGLATSEALSALTNLGYGGAEAAAAIAAAQAREPEAGTAALIRAALRALAPRE